MTHCGTTTNYRKGCRCDACRKAAAAAATRRRRERRQEGNAPHGTIRGYNDYGCRCEPCKAGYAAYFRGYRAEKAARGVPPDVAHGSSSAYGTYKCRCDACREGARLRDAAHTEATRDRHRQRDRRRNAGAQRQAYHHARRQKRKADPLDSDDRAYAAILFRDPCSYCGAPSTSIDHIVPIAAGGGNGWPNLTGACGPCNSSKRHQPLLRFLLRRLVPAPDLLSRTA
jgi:5-methylcytosine-specific restriction endonuclease McrA